MSAAEVTLAQEDVATIHAYRTGQISLEDAEVEIRSHHPDDEAARPALEALATAQVEPSDPPAGNGTNPGGNALGLDPNGDGHGNDDNSSDDPSETGLTTMRRNEQRELSPSDLSSHDAPDWSAEQGGRPSVRKRVDENLFPWTHTVDDRSLSPSARLQRQHLSNYRRDINYSVEHLRSAYACPRLPKALLADLLQGNYMDLGKLKAYHLSPITSIDKFTTTFMGQDGLQMQLGHKLESKNITTHGEWVTYFGQYQDALMVAFPFLKSDVQTYKDYISHLFTIYPESLHIRVIRFDAEVRTILANNSTLTFKDYDHSYLRPVYSKHFLMPNDATGRPANSSGGSSNKRGGVTVDRITHDTNGSEICRKYNKGTCHEKDCEYSHVCNVRDGGGRHPASDCARAKRKTRKT